MEDELRTVNSSLDQAQRNITQWRTKTEDLKDELRTLNSSLEQAERDVTRWRTKADGVAAAQAAGAERLQDEILVLRRRILELQDEKAAKEKPQIKPPPEKWAQEANWRSLRKGMSKQDVRRILGEPAKVSAYTVLGDTWYYGKWSGGYVNFDKADRVDGWSEP